MIYREALDANTAKRYWDSIKASVLTSFYTDTRIVSAIADSIKDTGISVKRCLDPSAGMGAFAETFAQQSSLVDAMEKDLLTARISQALHPYGEGNITIQNHPFEAIGEVEEPNKYDLVTSNIPFGDFMVYDRSFTKGKDVLKSESTQAIHNYFFVKGLDTLKEGGLLAFITSQGVLDAPRNEPIRRYLMQNSKLISAIRLPSGMFSENAGNEVGSDLIVLQKQSGKDIVEGLEQSFVRAFPVPTGDGFSMAFNHSSLFEGDWQEVQTRTIATSRSMGTDPYGKPTWVYEFDGGIAEMANSLRIQLSADIEQHFDKKLYETGVAMTEAERQAQAEKELRKLGVTVGLSETKEKQKKEPEVDEGLKDAYNLLPKSIEKQLPKLYSTEKDLIGDRGAYARYFFPMGAYTAYLLEYDPKERIGFGAVTMGYGWELGNISLDEMKSINIHGLGIERDLYFSPTKLHEIAGLEELVAGRYTQEAVVEEAVATEIKEEEQQKEVVSVQTEEAPKDMVSVQPEPSPKITEEPAPEGVPTLTLHRQYEAEPSVIRPDVEPPREMNGQTVYFDDDHHPIMEFIDDDRLADLPLFAPEEYNLWTQSVNRLNADIKEVVKPTPKPKEEVKSNVSKVSSPATQRKTRSSRKLSLMYTSPHSSTLWAKARRVSPSL